ncbi:MAG TPA: tape measure protein, partial [Pseudomonadales bacterium]|nr:tape measure protein [Pseudomonadales bacterium]
MNNSTVGQISYIARIGTKQLDKDAKDVESKVSNIGDSNEKQANRSTQTWSRFAKVGLGAVIGAAVAVGAAITTNIGGAIARVDTLNNSKRTFANMGFEASEAKLALDELNKSILGLPTSLDAGVRGMTQLAATYGSISTGQKVFTALNNAILGFGGTADEVNNAIIQLSQLPMDGPLDAQ